MINTLYSLALPTETVLLEVGSIPNIIRLIWILKPFLFVYLTLIPKL